MIHRAFRLMLIAAIVTELAGNFEQAFGQRGGGGGGRGGGMSMGGGRGGMSMGGGRMGGGMSMGGGRMGGVPSMSRGGMSLGGGRMGGMPMGGGMRQAPSMGGRSGFAQPSMRGSAPSMGRNQTLRMQSPPANASPRMGQLPNRGGMATGSPALQGRPQGRPGSALAAPSQARPGGGRPSINLGQNGGLTGNARPALNRPGTADRPSGVAGPGTGRPGGGVRPGGNRPGVGDFPSGANGPGGGRPSAVRPDGNLPGLGNGRPDSARPGGNRPGLGDRPSGGNGPGGGRPDAIRPGGNRPGLGGRPSGGSGPGAGRPDGARPGGDRPGLGDRPSSGGGPGTGRPDGARPGGNRPGLGDRPSGGNGTGRPDGVRPGGNRPGLGDRPQAGGPGNRPLAPRDSLDRARHEVRRPVGNPRPGFDTRDGRFGNFGRNNNGFQGRRPFAWDGRGDRNNPDGRWRYNRWSAFERGFVRGYWRGFGDGFWTGSRWGWGGLGWGLGGLGWGGWGWGLGGLGWGFNNFGCLGWGGLGWGLGGFGWGLPAWYLGSACYNWGYMPFYNPYVVGMPLAVAVDVPVGIAASQEPFDYSVPLNTEAEPEPSATDEAVALFDRARDLFKQQGYEPALQLTDQAIQKLPNDAALHEFRALVLFAQGRYDQASSVLYSVLAVGPGWDWATLIGLYPSVDVYTQQLRALEDYARRNRDSAAAAFLLAYHYLTAGTPGHLTAAAKMLRHVVELQPKDTIAPQLLAQIEKPAGEPALAPPADAPRPGDAKPAEGAPALTFPVEGTWTASPNEGTTITLKIDSKGGFSWVVTERGNDRTIEGDSTHGHGLLTLSSKTGGVMVGRTEWSDESHFTFRISGGPKDDPGLSFTKAAP